jgi:ABC-type molybdate transport system substrate-binding protein
MKAHAVRAAAIALAMMLAPVAPQAAELTCLCSNALKSVMEELAPRFEKATEHKLSITYGSTNPFQAT